VALGTIRNTVSHSRSRDEFLLPSAFRQIRVFLLMCELWNRDRNLKNIILFQDLVIFSGLFY